MHGSVEAVSIRGFARKEQSIVDGHGQRLRHFNFADLSIAIRTSRKRIGLPIVEICVFEKLFEFLNTDAQQTVEGRNAVLNHKRLALPGKARGAVKRRPAGQYGSLTGAVAHHVGNQSS